MSIQTLLLYMFVSIFSSNNSLPNELEGLIQTRECNYTKSLRILQANVVEGLRTFIFVKSLNKLPNRPFIETKTHFLMISLVSCITHTSMKTWEVTYP